MFSIALVTFAAVPALQIGVVRYGKDAPNLVSTINIGAFNVGNALGAWAGGVTIDRGFGLSTLPLVAAGITAVGLLLALWSLRLDRRQAAVAACPAE